MFNSLWTHTDSYKVDDIKIDDYYSWVTFTFKVNSWNIKIIPMVWIPIFVMILILIILSNQNILTRTERLVSTLKFIQNADLKQLLINFFLLNALLIINLPALVTLCSQSPLIFFVGFCIQPTFWVPVSIFILFNLTSFTNIGLTNKISINQIFFNDIITLTSFLLRFFSQFIRIALITIVLFLFYEYVDQLTNTIINQCVIFYNKTFKEILAIIIRLFVEWVDVNFILFVQTSAYFSVVFWLLIFLFLIKVKNIFEIKK